MWVDDLAAACVFCMQDSTQEKIRKEPSLRNNFHINVGSGHELSIKSLVSLIISVSGYKGDVRFDNSFPDGTIRKLMSSQVINRLGWSPTVDLQSGLEKVYSQYIRSVCCQ